MDNTEAEMTKPVNGKITCDQVVWILQMAGRYLPDNKDRLGIDKQRDMKRYAMLYEIMDILGLVFADSDAIKNATPMPVRTYEDACDWQGQSRTASGLDR